MVTGGGELIQNSDSRCTKCGFDNPPQMSFCGHCGTSLAQNDSHKPFNNLMRDLSPVKQDHHNLDQQCDKKPEGQINARRHVSVLFADLCSYSSLAEKIGDEDLFELLQPVINLFVQKVEAYGGQVNQFLGDGILAFFGAANAQENHVEMALRAALDMVRGIETLNQKPGWQGLSDLKIHIGVNTGTVILGVLGDEDTFEYTAIGDTVNLARRLQEVALPGEIYVSQSVVQSTQALFNFKQLPRILLKGISQPPLCYELLEEKAEPGSIRGIAGLTAKMVGREKELDVLLKAIQDTEREGNGHFCLISGEAGIGKSRLLSELKRGVDRTIITILEGTSLTYRRSVPYWVFIEIIRNLIGADRDDTDLDVHNKLYSFLYNILGAKAGEDIPYYEYLFSLEIRDPIVSRRIKNLDPQQLRQQIFLAVKELLFAVAKTKTLLLVIDDLHWADDTSLDLILYLTDTIHDHPIFICALSRPLENENLITSMEQVRSRLGESFIEIHIQNLKSEQSEQLIVELLRTADLPENLKQKIAEQSAGVPFYLEEIIRMLIDQHILENVDGRWKYVTQTDFEKLGVPNNLRDLILARFDQLPPDQQQILRVSSVLGRKIDFSLLRQLTDSGDEDELTTLLEQLVSAGFLLKEGNISEFYFRHVLTSDAIYATLLRAERVHLHTEVAEAIERCYSSQLDNYIEILASHYLRSSKLEKAIHYLLLAGERAARDFANDQARRHYEEAAEILPKTQYTYSESMRIWSGLGDIYTLTGEYPIARQYYQMAFNALPGDKSSSVYVESASLQRRIATTHERQGEYELASLRLIEARNSLEVASCSTSVEMARIYNDYGWLCFLRGDFPLASEQLHKGLNLVEGTENLEVIASIQNRLGAVAFQEQKFEEATHWVRRSLSIRKEIGDTIGVARAYNNLGLLGLVGGSLRDAEANFLQGLQQLERIGDAEGISLAKINCGLVKSDRGYFSEAEVYLTEGAHSAVQIHHRFYEALAKMYLGRLYSKLGDLTNASVCLSESLQIFKELGASDQLVDVKTYMAEKAIIDGDYVSAEAILDELNMLGDEEGNLIRPASGQYGRWLRLKATISIGKNLDEEGQKLLEDSVKNFAESGEKLEHAVTLAELGCNFANHGDLANATNSLDEARLIFKQIGADGELRKADQMLGQLKAKQGVPLHWQYMLPINIQQD